MGDDPGLENRGSSSARLRKHPRWSDGLAADLIKTHAKANVHCTLPLPDVIVQTETAVRAGEVQLIRGSAQSESDDGREQHEKELKVIGYDEGPSDNFFGDHQLPEIPYDYASSVKG